MTGRLSNKKNINRRGRQNKNQKKKKTTSIASLISPTTSNLMQPDEKFHHQTIFRTNI